MTTTAISVHVSTDAHGEPDAKTQQIISDGLDRYNESQVGALVERALWVVARANDDQVMGGLKAVVLWSWLFVDWLWVAEGARRKGVGSRLLCEAESVAVGMGCSNAFLNTFNFQAPEFYCRHGYEVFGQLEDFPAGNTRFWLRKTLKR